MSIGLRPPPGVLAATPQGTPARSLWSDAWLRLRRNRMAVAAGVFLLVMCTLAVLAPWLPWLADPAIQDLRLGVTPPSLAHVFGTDELGRDLFARVLYGGRISMLVGLVGTLVSLVIGVGWGAVAGYVGGRTDDLMMRVVDVLYALPYIFLVILLLVFFSRTLVMLFVALGSSSGSRWRASCAGRCCRSSSRRSSRPRAPSAPQTPPSSSATSCPTRWDR